MVDLHGILSSFEFQIWVEFLLIFSIVITWGRGKGKGFLFRHQLPLPACSTCGAKLSHTRTACTCAAARMCGSPLPQKLTASACSTAFPACSTCFHTCWCSLDVGYSFRTCAPSHAHPMALQVHIMARASSPWAEPLLGHETLMCPWFGPRLGPLPFM